MKVIVTGASGLIGREIIRALSGADFRLLAITRSDSRTLLDVVEQQALDLRNAESIPVLEAASPNLIVHGAATRPSEPGSAAAESAGRQNRAIDDVVMSVAERTQARMIYLSGTSLYGCVQTLCSEESVVDPRGAYLREKWRTESMLARLGPRATVLRISSPYGVRQRAMNVLLRFIRHAVRGEDLTYYGQGAREQDFVAAQDVAEAVRAVAKAGRSGIFNVASGRAISMKALADLVIRVVGSGRSLSIPAGVEDPEESCRARIDIRKAARELGWVPTVELVTGIQNIAATITDESRQ